MNKTLHIEQTFYSFLCDMAIYVHLILMSDSVMENKHVFMVQINEPAD